MSFEIERKNEAILVRLNVSRLDANTSRELRSKIENHSIKLDDRVVLDFEGVEFIDSSGLGALVNLMKHLGKTGEMILCSVHSKPIMDILNLTHMIKYFNIKDNAEEALAAFQSA